ncbi:hypothetical protein M8A51_10270 [Schlegelella sp. S2-27]|uniref:DUF2946 domain-containing protein n=1 Tax=Caldimonas mangrovi TaxID=2944811 RepID=A0ABT0YMG6_9BURK|nr:DUF2946 family protein [Caldimonas mangrovi]MCM5679917.1 hypothetical protein [Caldimonas mangrovi]
MSLRSWSTRCAFWAVAASLLLKAAVPLLAAAAAQVQGRTLVEICTVYGVRTVVQGEEAAALDADDGQGHDTRTLHGDSHCVLTGLLALAGATSAEAALDAPAAASRPRLPVLGPPLATLDKNLRWVMRLKHGPPARA